ncbi:MAG: adenylate cyclase [Comamonadaceae bacterium]|nr:adenylate cyclase [Comamonadaceae bacterium]
MARNIEIKARVDNLESLARRVETLANEGPVDIDQDDTFFNCERGRLKLRSFSHEVGELIFYRRDDKAGPKTSFYLRSPTTSPDVLRQSLALAYGEIGRVRKRRTLYLLGRTRVHLDQVEGLGSFLELEVVLADGEPERQGEAEAIHLMQCLGIGQEQLVERAYLDLLVGANP